VGAYRGALNWSDSVRSLAREVTIDQNVLAYTFGISVFAAILFGLAPAFHETVLDLQSTLKEGARTGSRSKGRNRIHSVLVTAEIALALALLTGAGIFVQDFLIDVHSRYGIDPNEVLTANISLSATRYKDSSRQSDFFKEAVERLQALPGVVSAGATTTLLPSVSEEQRVVTFNIAGQPALARSERATTRYYAISPEYLRTLRVPLLRGRGFLLADGPQAQPVALVNEAFVQHYLPKEDPVGKHVRIDTDASDRPDWSEIVGVVGNVNDVLEEQKDMPQIYEPCLQRPSSVMTLVVRTNSDPAALAPILRRAVWNLDKDQPITAVQTMNQVIADCYAGGVVMNTLMGLFAGLGLVLAMVGVFGVMVYTVTQRTHEIGIRMALGAQGGDVLGMVVRKGIILGACGVGIGFAFSAPLVWLRVIENAGSATPLDRRAPILLGAALLIGFAALLASYIVARRATCVDPMVALRHE
jgi:putative ABC transport system permease protein